MSLHNLSAHIASRGRGQDTSLVHMTDAELAGLNGLARKMGHEGLPTNPETGLPEAGILNSLLPIAAGFFLGPAGLGMSTLGAAATVGGVSALASGSLSKGLMAGMGAWGGAGLGGALTAGGVGEVAAQTAVEQAGAAGAAGAAEAAAASSAMPGATAAAVDPFAATASNFGAFGEAPLAQAAAGTPGAGVPGAMPAATPPAPVGAPPVKAQPLAPISPATTPTPNQFGAVSNAPGNPLQGAPTQRAQFAMGNDHMAVLKDNMSRLSLDPLTNDPMKFLKDNSMYAMAAAAPLMAPGEAEPLDDPTPAMIRPYTFNRHRTGAQGTGGRGEPRYFDDGYTAGTPYRADERRYAEGGAVAPAQGMVFDPATQTYKVQTGAEGAPAIDYGELPRFTYDAATQQYAPLALPAEQQAQTAAYEAQRDEMDRRMNAGAYDGALAGDGGAGGAGGDGGASDAGGFAYGGLTALARGGAPGRHLKGPGDGMSDSIPASIEGVQPAKLAADEFVVPADVVSHLGNGSSDAGAKQLYDMMARVRAQRTGRTKQAPAIKARKALPA